MSEQPIPFDTGALTPEQLRLILDALHVDVTFVDETRTVRYYNAAFRVFSRTPECIGTDVVDCHSPATRGQVAQLISEMQTGWRDDAQFLVENDGRHVDVRYVALRDGEGTYKGMLEIARYVDDGPSPRPTGQGRA